MKTPKQQLEANLARAQRRILGGVGGGGTSTMVNGRQYAVGVEGTVITYECKRHRHRYEIDHGSKRLRLNQRLGVQGAAMMAKWWSEERGGCIGSCPACEKESNNG